MARWLKTPGELERCVGAESMRTIRQEREIEFERLTNLLLKALGSGKITELNVI